MAETYIYDPTDVLHAKKGKVCNSIKPFSEPPCLLRLFSPNTQRLTTANGIHKMFLDVPTRFRRTKARPEVLD